MVTKHCPSVRALGKRNLCWLYLSDFSQKSTGQGVRVVAHIHVHTQSSSGPN